MPLRGAKLPLLKLLLELRFALVQGHFHKSARPADIVEFPVPTKLLQAYRLAIRVEESTYRAAFTLYTSTVQSVEVSLLSGAFARHM